MFRKLYVEIECLKTLIKHSFKSQTDEHFNTRDLINKLSGEYKLKLDSMTKTITSQQRTIEQLTNALQDKYEHGLFVLSDDCKMPIVIRNGEQMINKYTQWFRIDWTLGETPTLETEQMAGTFIDMED